MQITVKSQNRTITTQLPSLRFVAPTIAIISVGLALLASFVLANWAEASTLHHGIQHVLLFVAGVGVGGSVVAFKHRKESKEV